MAQPYTLPEHDITLQQIHAFLVIAKCRSLSKAAGEMFISQPALSKTLKRFEEGIGLPLFVRSNQGVALTETGKGLYLAFRSIYENLERTITWVKATTSAQKVLHMAVPLNYDFSDDFTLIKSLVKKYEERNAGIRIMESLFDLKQLCQSMEYGGVDLMLVPSFFGDSIRFFSRKHISEFELCLAVSAESSYKSIDQPELFENQTVYALSTTDSAGDMEYFGSLCRRIGFTPARIEYPPNCQTLLHAVRLGRGIGLCWTYKYPGSGADIRYLPIPHAISRLYIDAVWNPAEISPEAQRFIDMLP
jgi:DNA-binding transcriptional LysR family regulator